MLTCRTMRRASSGFVAGPGFAVVPGSSGSTAFGVEGYRGFNGSLTYSASGLPNGVTASFSPNPTMGITMLTLTASSYAAVLPTPSPSPPPSALGLQCTLQFRCHHAGPRRSTMNASSGQPDGGPRQETIAFTIATRNVHPRDHAQRDGLPAGSTAAFAPIR